MKKILRIRGFLFMLFILLTFLSSPTFAKVKPKTDVDKDALMKKISTLQIPFIENQGQIKPVLSKAEGSESVKFYANTFAGTVFVTDKGEIVYSLIKAEPKEDARYKMQDTELKDKTLHLQTKAVAIKESLEYPSQNTDKIKITGINKSETKVNYFVGAKDNWRTNIETWQEVSFGEVYKGIELKLKAYGKNVEKLFTVHPGGFVDDIKLKIEGAKGLKVNKDGELEVETELGTIKFTRPIAYQEIDGKMVEVSVAYIIPQSETHNQQFEYAFKIGNYDRTKELVIDPLLASTFLGADAFDSVGSISIDIFGNVYVAGGTSSSDFPVVGGYDNGYNSNSDVFVAKFNNSLNSLLASTFLGGNVGEDANSVAIDSNGNIYVAGHTNSLDFPIVGGYDNTYNGGNYDTFVAKFDNSLSSLLASTFLGGSSWEYINSIAIDSANNVFVVGQTYYSANFPNINGFDTTHNGTADGFIVKFNSSLSSLLASTFLGGSSIDSVNSIVTDSNGNVFVAGDTLSSGFPIVNGYDSIFNGYYSTTNNSQGDGFAAKFDNSLSSLLASTFLGNDKSDYAYSMVIDTDGYIYVAGYTASSFPSTICNGCLIPNKGLYDVFVAKLNNSLSSLLASTMLGDNNHDYAYSVAIDFDNNIYVTGHTSSQNFPIVGGYDGFYNGGNNDVFIAKFNNSLSLLSSTFLGGSLDDHAYSIDIDTSGNIYVAGDTYSSNFPIIGGFDNTYGGSHDAFIARLDNNLSAVDNDGDSYLSNVDCNDNDPLVNLGATEICDGVDNNCDGSLDEGCNVDLYISSMSAPISANAGDTISVSDTTNKSGVSLVGPTTTKIYLSTDNKYSTSDTYLGERAVGSFGAGAGISSGTTNITIPSNACTQTYYLIARADADNVVPEWNEGNNNRTRAIGITNPTPRVDLYISSITTPGSATAGETISVNDTTNKSGPCASDASTTKIYLSTDNKYSTSDTYLGERAVGSFGAGAGNNSGSTNVTIPSGTPAGSYYIIVRADADKVITEWNEGNNNRAGAITITSP